MEVGTLLLGNDKNKVNVDKVLHTLFLVYFSEVSVGTK